MLQIDRIHANRFMSSPFSAKVLYHVCAFWFELFKSGDFSLIDKPRPGGRRKCDNDDLEQLLTEN